MDRSTALIFVAAFLLGGCAIHPLPENVTRDTTYDIVQKIRCEGREALDNISIRLFRRSTDQRTLDLADRVAAGELTVPEVFFVPKYRRNLFLDKETTELFLAYTLSAVTFDFDFQITEDNNNMANANFTLPMVNGIFTLAANAGAELNRKSERKFQITNSFAELHTLDRRYCESIAARIGNIVYPITGKIGLEEVFETFVNLDSRIGVTPTDPAKSFSDQLTFTTTLNAGATPKIALNPVADNRFRLADASATLSASRTDEHEVTIAIARGAVLTPAAIALFEPKILNKARVDAKTQSKFIADQRRMEDVFIIPRNKAIIINR
jgi:hypothetical protein